MKFSVVTLGCKVNQYESHAIESILRSRGHIQVESCVPCDVYIVNTCAVTAESVRKSRQAVRRAKNLAEGALIAVCGCLSHIDPGEAISLGVDFIGGSSDRQGFALEIERLWDTRRRFPSHVALPEHTPTPDSFPVLFEDLPPGVAAGRTRALLKIQDGCDNYCAYCVIPYARGGARSLPLEKAVGYASQLKEQGFREIVITGIEISSYGADLAACPSLTDVVKGISSAAPHVRLRLGSISPGAVTEAFCNELSMVTNLCDHFHLSLQSGCDETLRRMGRKYDTRVVSDVISSLRHRYPDCGITADLIAGFPGETDEEFMQTMEFIKTAAFSDMHIFPFSQRPGTKAATMPGQVSKSIRRERARVAAVVAEKMAHDFRLSQIGKSVEVLFERERGGYWLGHSGNYLEVAVKNGGAKNTVRTVRLTEVKDKILWGEIIG